MTSTVTARSVVGGDEELVIPGERLEEFRGQQRFRELVGHLTAVRRDHLPWLAQNAPPARVIVNVVGFEV